MFPPGAAHPLRKLAAPERPEGIRFFLRTLFREDWVVYAKPPFGGPERVLRYLARYTHRVAISNHRLLAFENDRVTFLWKDYTHGNKKRKMTLSSQEFLRRFLLHVLPHGFVRIRFYGFLAPRQRAKLLPLCQRLLLDHPKPYATDRSASSTEGPAWFRCPYCATPMVVVERFSPLESLSSATRTPFDTS